MGVVQMAFLPFVIDFPERNVASASEQVNQPNVSFEIVLCHIKYFYGAKIVIATEKIWQCTISCLLIFVVAGILCG